MSAVQGDEGAFNHGQRTTASLMAQVLLLTVISESGPDDSLAILRGGRGGQWPPTSLGFNFPERDASRVPFGREDPSVVI